MTMLGLNQAMVTGSLRRLLRASSDASVVSMKEQKSVNAACTRFRTDNEVKHITTDKHKLSTGS